MNTEERALILNKFIDHMDSLSVGSSEHFVEDINQLEYN